MLIIVNGESQHIAENSSVQELVAEVCGQQQQGVAVARNGEIVRRSDWSTTVLQAGDQLEVLRATSGG